LFVINLSFLNKHLTKYKNTIQKIEGKSRGRKSRAKKAGFNCRLGREVKTKFEKIYFLKKIN